MSKQIDNPVFFTDLAPEIRSAEGQPDRVFGYWAVFNRRSRTMVDKEGQRFQEVILPTAFRSTDFSDLGADFEHELFLAAPPTLRYGMDEKGAWYEYDHDPTDPDHCRMLPKIKRGDVKGSSFEFYVRKGDYDFKEEGEMVVRYIHTIPAVRRVGPVVTPAYRDTTAIVRSYQEFQAEQTPDEPTPEQKLLESRQLEARRFLR